ncbi:uncharacterized protein LOC133284010 [Gastrolobium bilobum]|uniref:uncharacterized protein LOC133284010 n=1 Tax=Gastrolobium bilobum TaxID=150636 RepID=UPI002AB11A58|nr:uncharacterized protein LOC133284010 [Gastrolobium bilobum]
MMKSGGHNPNGFEANQGNTGLGEARSFAVLALLETKIQGARGDVIIRKLGFSKKFKQETVGFSGGVWILWDDRDVEVEIIKSHHQYVHTRIHYVEDKRMEVATFVYGSPRRVERLQLWEELLVIADSVVGPWVLVGDFNSVLRQYEKVGGLDVCWRSIQDMQECLEKCRVFDVGFKGPSYTWRRGKLEERIDRACANEAWNVAWPNRVIAHLPFFNSDHRPILISNFQACQEVKGDKQFKFLAAWTEARSEFETAASKWHQEVFNEGMRQKHRIYARIQGLDLKLEAGPDRELEKLQRDLWKELETILLREELNWFQRSRVNWLKFGDRNSRFFHSSTIARRRRNKVLAIKNDLGEWTADTKELVETAVQYFERLFLEEDDSQE